VQRVRKSIAAVVSHEIGWKRGIPFNRRPDRLPCVELGQQVEQRCRAEPVDPLNEALAAQLGDIFRLRRGFVWNICLKVNAA
jgi:hypothetical protein